MTFLETIRASQGRRLMIGGHRGHLSAIRENTLPNFAEVQRHGIPYNEIDVQLSKDHEAVIFHDSDLSLNTPLTGTVSDYTVSELKSSFELCTLSEAVHWCREQNMLMMLEIKSRHYDDPARCALSRRIVQAIREDAFTDFCIPFSIDYAILRMIRKELLEVKTALIVPAQPEDPVALMESMEADIYLSYLEDMTPQLVSLLHDAGYLVDGSVVNTREKLEMALSMKVDMIESDAPEAMEDMYQSILRGE